MKTQLLNVLTAITLFIIPNVNFGQTAPTLGTTSSFALFTAGGAFSTNSEAGTIVTGDVGNHTGANSAFPPGTLNGTAHWLDGVATTAATDVVTAYTDLNQGGTAISATLDGQALNPGVFFTGTGAAATLSGTLTLDGGGNSNAIFIIRIDGALTIATSSNISLIGSASLCNVYWQVNGQFDLGAGSVFRGTLINDGAINLLEGSSLFGRGLTTAGAINLYNNVVTIGSSPAAAGTITGTSTVCQGQTGVAYSVSAITNATSYIWTLPTGATITAGANTNSITVSFSASAASGNITVQGSSSCGTGTVSANFAVTVNSLPSAAGTITGTSTVCQGQTGVAYSVSAITNATSYIWTLPTSPPVPQYALLPITNAALSTSHRTPM